MTLIPTHSALSDFFHFILSYLVRPASPQFLDVQISILRWSRRTRHIILFPMLLLVLGIGVGKHSDLRFGRLEILGNSVIYLFLATGLTYSWYPNG